MGFNGWCGVQGIEGAKSPRNQRGVLGATPGNFSKKAGKWCKSKPPWLFFQRTKKKRPLLKKETGIDVTGVLLCCVDPSCTFRFAKLVYNQM